MNPNVIPSAGVVDHVAAAGLVPDAFAFCYLVGGGVALAVWVVGALLFGRKPSKDARMTRRAARRAPDRRRAGTRRSTARRRVRRAV